VTPTGRTVAAFDFDGTLTRRDTLVQFLASIAGWAAVARAFGAESPRLARMALGRADRDDTKERVLTRVLQGRPFADVQAAGRAYGRDLASTAIAPDMRARIAWHRRAGHEIVIVSASLDVYLVEVASALAVEHLLCTSLEVDAHGNCTGRMLEGNCRGAAKADRLRAHVGAGDVTIWAYGDSSGDDEMLAMADHAIRVRRARIHRPNR
jgi:phosphatidylglycerophosphatase C